MAHSELGARLRAARLARGWRLEDVAVALRDLDAELGDPESRADLHHVYKWESGARNPNRRYQARLCLVFDAMPKELGFTETPRLLRDLGELRHRRLSNPPPGGTPAGADAERLQAAVRRLWPVDRPLMQGIERAGRELIRRSDSEAPPAIVPDMVEFRQAIMALLSRSQPEDAAAQMQTIASELSRSVAWLTDHTRKWPETYANYALAEALAREAGDGNQLGQVLVNKSEMAAGRAGLPEDMRAAVDLAEHAALAIGADALAGLKCWVLGVRAIYAADQGDELTARRRLEDAYRLAAVAPHEMNLFSDLDSAWLDSYRAATVLKLRPVEAIDLLEDVVRNTSPALTWERVSALNRLAEALIAAGDVDQACAMLAQSIELAHQTGDERGLTLAWRSRSRHLGRWSSERSVRRLDEAIRAAR